MRTRLKVFFSTLILHDFACLFHHFPRKLFNNCKISLSDTFPSPIRCFTLPHHLLFYTGFFIYFFFNDFKSMETVSGRSTDIFIPAMTPLRNFFTLRAINQHTGFPQLFSEQQKCFHSCGPEATQDASTCMLCVLGCSSHLLRLAVGLNFQRMVGWEDRLGTSSFRNFPFLQF